MRVSIDNTTGLMIESQSHAREGTLIQNALSAGFTDVSERVVTEQEHTDLLSAKIALLPQSFPVVSPWQFRKALNQANLRQPVEDAVAASTDQDVKDGWEFATEFRRDDPLVIMMAATVGVSESDLDSLFALAATL